MQEVEILCKRVLILNQGLVVAQGTSTELNRTLSGHRQVMNLVLEGVSQGDLQTAIAGLPEGATVSSPLETDERRVSLEVSLSKGMSEKAIFDWAVSNHFTIVGMNTKTMDLEEIFRRLTQSDTKS